MPNPHPARYCEPQHWDAVQCLLCPHQCSIAPSRQGACGIRGNRNGTLYSLTYGRVSDTAPLAIEEVPLFHFHPGSRWLRIAGVGCNMHCPFCNTWRYSQAGGVRARVVEPVVLVEEALDAKVMGLAFMVNEPAVWHEYVVDVATEARTRGLRTLVATSGMWSAEPFAELSGVVDAILFGFKGMDSAFWQEELGGLLEQTRINLEMAVDLGCHVEVSYLVVEDATDSPEQVDAFAEWLLGLDSGIAVHVLGYRPDFQWKRPAASPEAIRTVVERLAKKMAFVYTEDGGLADSARETRCPSCGRVVVSRSKIRGVGVMGLKGRACAGCSATLPILADLS